SYRLFIPRQPAPPTIFLLIPRQTRPFLPPHPLPQNFPPRPNLLMLRLNRHPPLQRPTLVKLALDFPEPIDALGGGLGRGRYAGTGGGPEVWAEEGLADVGAG